MTSSRRPVSLAPLIEMVGVGMVKKGEVVHVFRRQKEERRVLLVMQVRVRMGVGVGYGEREYFEGLPPCAIPLTLPILIPGITIARGLPVPVHVRDMQKAARKSGTSINPRPCRSTPPLLT
jgi:hypothetical protein